MRKIAAGMFITLDANGVVVLRYGLPVTAQ
jgi:hypothetical protein